MNDLVSAYMNREGITKSEAEELVNELRARVFDGEDPEEILYEEGFEPDYIFDII